ncbi:glycosyltransferase [Microbulbifer bruguierae]|uniref:Glycosyltransferase n=1 Tax=Microbulbifer bruguierae TaxID=3029061 RepID=A0ABY8N8P0_9GAMM|nr:glycosyltransferase [Microbulbifer bruguierae]WGL15261.1 glycosyltransferase [Microbulbifer bruguierae]
MKKLLVISSAPAGFIEGTPYLDVKFVEGMRFYCDAWDGEVSCILRKRDASFPFGKIFREPELPFHPIFKEKGAQIRKQDIEGYDLVLCSGDNQDYLHVSELCRKNSVKIVYIIEYIFETRIQAILLQRGRSLVKKLYAMGSALLTEIRRRRAFRLSDGLQANGFPARNAYLSLNQNTLLYLDNRIRDCMQASNDEVTKKFENLKAGAPLKLIHSGRLEPMKGSQDIVPILRSLNEKSVNFELHIFGAGSLEKEIQQGIRALELTNNVYLHGAVDFENELVPFARENAHIFLCCHRQSDPSCSYLENMGCGVAIAGYDNRMWKALSEASQGGHTAPLGNPEALATLIAEMASDPDRIFRTAQSAHSYARAHSFEHEFQRRIQHLMDTLHTVRA